MSKGTSFSIGPVLLFVLIALGGTWGIEYHLISQGIRFDTDIVRYTPLPWLFATMWMPTVAALLVSLVVERASPMEVMRSLSMRIGSLGPYLLIVLLAPVIYAAMYGLSWAFGLTAPDLALSTLPAQGYEEITSETILTVMLPLSAAIGPFMHFPFALGEEIGWRGFLLNRLMPLGKRVAYPVVALVWGLWHAPLIWVGFNYPNHPVAGIALMCVMTFAFGLFLNELFLGYRSTILAAFIHAAFNAQGFGIWIWLFPGVNPLLGGGTGLVAVLVWGVTGIVAARIIARQQR